MGTWSQVSYVEVWLAFLTYLMKLRVWNAHVVATKTGIQELGTLKLEDTRRKTDTRRNNGTGVRPQDTAARALCLLLSCLQFDLETEFGKVLMIAPPHRR